MHCTEAHWLLTALALDLKRLDGWRRQAICAQLAAEVAVVGEVIVSARRRQLTRREVWPSRGRHCVEGSCYRGQGTGVCESTEGFLQA